MMVKTAIEFPKESKTVPQAYSQYCLEAAFYEHLGWTYKDLDTRPRRQVHDYKIIMTLVNHHERAMMESRNNAAKG
jgi:hypothetical protein